MEGEAKFDKETLETLRRLHEELELEDVVDEEIAWQDVKPWPVDPVDILMDRVISIKERIYKRFRRTKTETKTEILPDNMLEPKSGDELTRELEDAWNLYTRGGEEIPSRSVGYVLRILGQNPTEDEIVDMVMKANCDWDGPMNRKAFLGVAVEILKSSCDQMDDVKAAFRVFDHNNDGSISKDELKEALVNFGTRCTDEEFCSMFAEADKNNDGLIDFDEFVMMMLPSTNAAHGAMGKS